jgi:transmembrane sensor
VHADGWQAWLADRRASTDEQPDAVADLAVARNARHNRRPRWLLGGLGVAVAAALAFVAAPAALLRLQSDHVTSTAELRTVDLEDGSTVTLSASSAIAVSYSGSERRVTLLEGEAFFQVRRDPARPFRVLAGEVQTTVVGTAFDVRRAGDDVTVDVQEGVVEVGVVTGRHAGAQAGERLEAGQSVSIGASGASRRTSLPPQLVGAWRQGRLLTQELPLRDAVDQLRRHFSGMIVLTDPSLGERRITGAYTLSEPEDALRAIARAHGAVVRRITPWILVISPS